jgi:acyl carrier protein
MGLHLHPSQVIFPAEQREGLSMKEKLRDFIKTHMINDARYPLKDDEPLITGGLVDSFSLTQLAVFIEEEFGVHFDDPELTADNMNTLNQIVSNIEAKQ